MAGLQRTKEIQSDCTEETCEQYFIGSGTVLEQFRLQVATSVTRQYIAQCGTELNEGLFTRSIRMIDDLSTRPEYYRDFLEAVRDVRYINEEDELNPEPAALER